MSRLLSLLFAIAVLVLSASAQVSAASMGRADVGFAAATERPTPTRAATAALSPGTSGKSDYAAREANAKGLEKFAGGDVVVITTTTLVVVLIVILILVLI